MIFRNPALIALIIMFSFITLGAKPLERIANEMGVQGETQFNDGQYLDAAQSFLGAIDNYKQAVRVDNIPEDVNKIFTWYNHTYQAYLNAGDFNKALEIMDKKIELQPDNFDLIKDKAIILKKYLDKPLDAIQVLKDFDSKKRDFEVEKRIASYYADLEDYEKALYWYQKAYEIKKDSVVIQYIASLNVKLGRNQAAIQAYEDFLATNPKTAVLAKTYRNMGALYEEIKNDRKSIEYFEKSNEIKYDNKVTLLLIVKYYDYLQFDKATENINKLLAKRPGDHDAIYYRAKIAFDKDQKKAARSDFSKLLNDPKYGKVAKGYIESIDSE
ncbi:MAG: hypothetical protein JW996_00125 [Candidatus Cloacimonetes bacterium]|nr:hypothetical protein [Candidatus Cloacimonadota bacterium]